MKNNKDRIICVSEAVPTKMKVRGKNKYKDASYFRTVVTGKHTFYYQPENTSQRIFLFSTKRYAPSVAAFFAEKGVLVCDDRSVQTHSITLDELYRLKNYQHNYILNKIINRISIWVNDVIRYEVDAPMVNIPEPCEHSFRSESRYWDDDRAA